MCDVGGGGGGGSLATSPWERGGAALWLALLSHVSGRSRRNLFQTHVPLYIAACARYNGIDTFRQDAGNVFISGNILTRS